MCVSSRPNAYIITLCKEHLNFVHRFEFILIRGFGVVAEEVTCFAVAPEM